MKIDKIKHDHSLTKLLKVLIFAIVMLIPTFSVASRCLYVICNKNAYQSYSNKYVQSTTEITSPNNIVEGATYNIYYKQTDNGYFSGDIYWYDKININWYDYTGTDTSHNYIGISLESYNNPRRIRLFYDETDITKNDVIYQWATNNINEITLRLTNYTQRDGFVNTMPYTIYMFNYVESSLDSVFSYSMEQLSQDEYLQWTQNTAIYTGINTMNTQLGITMPTYSMVLTYWFFMIVIYVIIDIILGIFTALTHMLGKKME